MAVGGCWYLLAGVDALGSSVKISVFRDRPAQLDQGEVAVSGLGGKAYWDKESGNLEVQAGRNVLWVEVGSIKADDKLTGIARRAGAGDPVNVAKQLLALRVGATVLADHHGDTDAARLAKHAALALLRPARATPTP